MNNEENYYQIAKKRLAKQLETVDNFNTKINTLLVTCSVFVVFLGEVASRKNLLLGIGIPFITIALFVLLVAYRIGDWQDTPNPERVLYDLQQGTIINDFYAEVTADIVECYKENKILLQKKVKRINLASIFLMLGVGFSIVSVIIYLF